jgi:hypothetical protein
MVSEAKGKGKWAQATVREGKGKREGMKTRKGMEQYARRESAKGRQRTHK